MYTAVLIDTVSIQSYIFGSNKLKENIGGSFIIEHWIYHQMIPIALRNAAIDAEPDINAWREKPEVCPLKSDPNALVEIGYIGGGNAFLIFKNSQIAKTFIKTYSQLLLQYFPGLTTAYGIVENFDYPENEPFQQFRKGLSENLFNHRSQYGVLTTPFKHGIVDDCAWSNEAQEQKLNSGTNTLMLSKMSASRVKAVESSQKYLNETYARHLREKYTFTTELNQLGQDKDKGYVAVVHADGNGMGKRFMACKNLAEVRALSRAVSDLSDYVMSQLIETTVGLFENNSLPDFNLKNDKSDKLILPIRPLIAGGDDITFVCEGRLGVYFAEKILEFLTTTPVMGTPISACAGVAIVHTKYPFYKAYHLAEQLTAKAKAISRKEEGSSWLQFLISTGGFTGSYDDIIRQHYTLPGGKELKMGAYQIGGQSNSMALLKAGMNYFTVNADSGWPRNKIKEMTRVLRSDDASRQYFLAEMEASGRKLPKFNGHQYHKTLWEDNKTPYFDMAELLDFYPKELL